MFRIRSVHHQQQMDNVRKKAIAVQSKFAQTCGVGWSGWIDWTGVELTGLGWLAVLLFYFSLGRPFFLFFSFFFFLLFFSFLSFSLPFLSCFFWGWGRIIGRLPNISVRLHTVG